MLKITHFSDEHLEDAADMCSKRFRQLHAQEPLLPARYTESSEFLPLLKSISSSSYHGVAAVRENRLVGYLTGWLLPSFRGKRSVFSPEWANGADLEDSQYIYEEMYSHAAAGWVADKYSAHYLSIFPNDVKALRALHWLGFGMTAFDALRGLEKIPDIRADIEIRLADLDDLDEVMAMDEALWEHVKGTPDFLLSERKDRDHYADWIKDPEKSIWLAYENNKPAAFMSMGPANEDVCGIIVDEKTTSIYEAYTKEAERGKGIASALLNHVLETASAAGYERCAVDFEPMNLAGTRFWLRHFRPVCYSLFRQIDERLIN